jgi:hypothetical protein
LFPIPPCKFISAYFCGLTSAYVTNERKKGWNEVIQQAMSDLPEEARTGKTMGGQKIKPGSFIASDLNFSRQGMAHMYGAMLAHLDSGDNNNMAMDTDRVVAFTSDFF